MRSGNQWNWFISGRQKNRYTGMSAIIVECAGNKTLIAIQEHIRKQIARLEQFGKVSFKNATFYKVDNRQKITFWTRATATLSFITFLKNTGGGPTSQNKLSKHSFEMREELSVSNTAWQYWELGTSNRAESTYQLVTKQWLTGTLSKVKNNVGLLDSLTSEELEQ